MKFSKRFAPAPDGDDLGQKYEEIHIKQFHQKILPKKTIFFFDFIIVKICRFIAAHFFGDTARKFLIMVN